MMRSKTHPLDSTTERPPSISARALSVGIVALLGVLVSGLAQSKREDLADRLDFHGRWIYISVFLVLLVGTIGR